MSWLWPTVDQTDGGGEDGLAWPAHWSGELMAVSEEAAGGTHLNCLEADRDNRWTREEWLMEGEMLTVEEKNCREELQGLLN